MQSDPLCLDMDRCSKANPNSKSSNGSKSLANSAQTSDRSKDPLAFTRNPRKNKTAPQKIRSWQDKRPQARSYGANTETYRGKLAYEAQSGYGAFCDEQRQKKVNLNHLLNFTYNSASFVNSTQNHGYYDSRPTSRAPRAGKARALAAPRYNKELYLQANCQFVVKAEGDYAVHAMDPDHPVDWDLIEQVRINSVHIPSCPICLYPPTAGKIAKCGHVFCYSCILHYLALSDKPWRKCPICYDAIDRKTLKSLATLSLKEFKVGDEIKFLLMKRERNSTRIFPVGTAPDENYPTVVSSEGDQLFAKVVTATPAEVLAKIVQPEEEILMKQLKEDGNEPEACFIEEAIALVAERKTELEAREKMRATKEKMAGLEAESGVAAEVIESPVECVSSPEEQAACIVPPELERIVYASAFDETVAEPCDAEENSSGTTSPESSERGRNVSECSGGSFDPETILRPEDLDISGIELGLPDGKDEKNAAPGSGARSKQPKNTFYFYQSADGQNIYMHALNVKMLASEYITLENCPSVITGRVVELESAQMNQELRERLRYLQHLPVTTTFQVAEILVEPGKISRETFRMFRDEVDERRRKRARRARVEERREKRISEKQLQSHAPPGFVERRRFEPHEDPSVVDGFDYNTDFAPLPSSEASEPLVGQQPQAGGGSVSFATMLKEGKKTQVQPVPKVEQPKHSGTLTLSKRRDTEDDDGDFGLPAPTYRESMGDAIALALERAAQLKGSGNDGSSPSDEQKASGKRKKKSGRGIVLFQTSMVRGSGK